MRRLSLLLLFAVAAPSFAQKEFGFDNRKGSGQPYLKPEESVKKLTVPPEFEAKLFAGEPDCVNPVAFSIDEKGRVWVLECFEYPSRTPKGKAPRDRIVILEDTDGDGKCDKRTVFAEGKDFPISEERKKAGLGAFDLATGLEVGNGGVYVGAPPYLWHIENKDDKPGKFETLAGGFGSQDTHETLNTFQWGPDGWLYGMQGVFTQSTVKPLDGPETRMNAAVWRFHPKTKKFEIFAEGTSNPWGMDWRNTDGQFILACCVIPHLYHIVPGGVYRRQAGASYNPYAYGYINEISDHTFHKESGWAHAGLLSLDVPHMPEKYRNSVIFGSIHGCSVKQNVLKPNGSSYTASRGDDFLVSADKNFRPINMKWGPNGDIYLIDWHDQMPCHQAKADEWDYERGRVYRIQLKDRKGGKAEDLGKKTDEELVQYVLGGKATPWNKRSALRLLGERTESWLTKHDEEKDEEKRAELTAKRHELQSKLLEGAPKGTDRQYGVDGEMLNRWMQFPLFNRDKMGLPQHQDFALYLRLMRLHIVPLATKALLEQAKEHDSPAVRRELASLAIQLLQDNPLNRNPKSPEAAEAFIRHLLSQKDNGKDPLIPHLTWLAYEKILASGGRQPPVPKREGEPKKQGADAPRSPKIADELAFLAKEAPDNIFVRDHIVPKVMRRLVATGQPEDLAACLKFVADVTDMNTREKALDGLAVALAGQTVNAPKEWAALQPELRKDARLVPLVNKLAVAFRDPAALERALFAFEKSSASAVRNQALADLVQLQHPSAKTIVAKALRSHFDEGTRLEAARLVGAFDDPKYPDLIIANWKDYPKAVHGTLTVSLSSRKAGAKALLAALQEKKIDRADVSDNTILKMLAFNDKEITDTIEKAWGRVRKTPDELNKVIDKTRAGLAAAPASFARGKAVFEAQCMKCHKFDGKGVEVGPQLDGAARDIEYLLANVIDPNRVIGAPYFLRTVNTLDGQAIQGILAEEDDKFLTLKVENAKLVKIAKKDFDGPVKVQEKSMMPEGLTATMTEQNFRDLLRYVMLNPYVTDVKVGDKAVSAGVTGRIPLPAGKDVAVVAEFTAGKEFTTKVLIGATDAFELKIDDYVWGKTAGGKQANPDGEFVEVRVTEGKHTLTLARKGEGKEGAVYLRFLDPDRKLSYPEAK